MKYLPIDDPELEFLAQGWVAVDSLARQRTGEALRKDETGLQLLQTMWDETGGQGLEPYVLGIALGRILVAELGNLDWVIVEDSYGRDLVLRYNESSFIVNVIGMVNKRAAKNERVDLKRLFSDVHQAITHLSAQAD